MKSDVPDISPIIRFGKRASVRMGCEAGMALGFSPVLALVECIFVRSCYLIWQAFCNKLFVSVEGVWKARETFQHNQKVH